MYIIFVIHWFTLEICFFTWTESLCWSVSKKANLNILWFNVVNVKTREMSSVTGAVYVLSSRSDGGIFLLSTFTFIRKCLILSKMSKLLIWTQLLLYQTRIRNTFLNLWYFIFVYILRNYFGMLFQKKHCKQQQKQALLITPNLTPISPQCWFYLMVIFEDTVYSVQQITP